MKIFFILISLLITKDAFASLNQIEIYNYSDNPYEKVEIFLPNNVDPIIHHFKYSEISEPKCIELEKPINLTQEKINYYPIKSSFTPEYNELKDPVLGCNGKISYHLYLPNSELPDTIMTKFFTKDCPFPSDYQMSLSIRFNKEKTIEKLKKLKK